MKLEIAALRRAYTLGTIEDSPLVYRVPRFRCLKVVSKRTTGARDSWNGQNTANCWKLWPIRLRPFRSCIPSRHACRRVAELHRAWVGLAEGVIYVNGRTTKNKRSNTVPIYGEMRSWLESQLTRRQTLAPKNKQWFAWEDGSPTSRISRLLGESLLPLVCPNFCFTICVLARGET